MCTGKSRFLYEDFASWYFSHVEIEQIKRHCVLCKYEQLSQDSLYMTVYLNVRLKLFLWC